MFPPANGSTQVRLRVDKTQTPFRPQKMADVDIVVRKRNYSSSEV